MKLQLSLQPVPVVLASNDSGQCLEKRLRWTAVAAGNMALISVSMAKSWPQKYVIAASAAGSSSQNEICAGLEWASAGPFGARKPSARHAGFAAR